MLDYLGKLGGKEDPPPPPPTLLCFTQLMTKAPSWITFLILMELVSAGTSSFGTSQRNSCMSQEEE